LAICALWQVEKTIWNFELWSSLVGNEIQLEIKSDFTRPVAARPFESFNKHLTYKEGHWGAII